VDLFMRRFDENRVLQSAVENIDAAAMRIRTALDYALRQMPREKQLLLEKIPGNEERLWGFSLLLGTWGIVREHSDSALQAAVKGALGDIELGSFWRALDERKAVLGFVSKAYQATRHQDLREAGSLLGRVLGGSSLDLFASILASESFLVTGKLSERLPVPYQVAAPLSTCSDLDVEAAARMLASENPRASEELHAEQIWTQLRLRKPKQNLYDRITAGSGWGPQGGRSGNGRARPVATTEEATDVLRERVRLVLIGELGSSLPRATKWFEPEIQDRAYRKAKQLQAKRERGESLTESEQHLLLYSKSADEVRADWQKKGGLRVGDMEGLEFWT